MKLLEGPLTGLPDGLAPRQGLAENSLGEHGGRAQGLTAEARLLAQPVSFELVTTTHAEGIEDRMTMAPLAARRLGEMVELGERSWRSSSSSPPRRSTSAGRRASAPAPRRRTRRVREVVPFLAEGEPLVPDLEPVRELIRTRAFRLTAARQARRRTRSARVR